MIFWLALAITTTTHAAVTDGLGTDDRGADAAVMPGMVVVQFKAGIEIPHGVAKSGVASFDQVAAKHQVYAIEKAFPFLEAVAAKRTLSEKAEALRRIYVVRYRTPMRPRHVAAMLAQDPNVVFAEPQLVPTTPTVLLVTAAAAPATWVPWAALGEGLGSGESVMKFHP